MINRPSCAVRASWAPLHTANVKGLGSFYGVRMTFIRDNFKFRFSLGFSLSGLLLIIISAILCSHAELKTQQLVHAGRILIGNDIYIARLYGAIESALSR